MDDVRIDLATLVADTLAWLDAWRRDGGAGVPDGALEGLPPAPAFIPSPPPSARGAVAPPARSPVAAPVFPPVRPAPAAPPAGPRAGGGGGSGAPEPATSTAGAAAPPVAPGAGLFGGRWATATETPAVRLAKVVAALPAVCASCGQPPPRGVGPATARLMVVAATLAGESAAMFQKMLVHVLAMEPTDVWVVAPSACAGCVVHLRAQVDVLAPRLVLAMGDPARAVVGLAGRGVWGRWAGADVLATHHPDEVLAQLATGAQEARRATFEHLKELARRV